MKTLNDLRAALVVGSRWKLDSPWCPEVRRLGHVQGNAFAFDKGDALGTLSWCDFPKASEVKLGDREFTITNYVIDNELHYIREDKWLEDQKKIACCFGQEVT